LPYYTRRLVILMVIRCNLRWIQSERRIEPRYSLECPIWVEVTHGKDEDILAARIVNMSDHGLGLTVEESRLPVGSRVYVRFNGQEIEGRVRHCRKDGDTSFQIGLMLKTALTDEQMDALLAYVVVR